MGCMNPKYYLLYENQQTGIRTIDFNNPIQGNDFQTLLKNLEINKDFLKNPILKYAPIKRKGQYQPEKMKAIKIIKLNCNKCINCLMSKKKDMATRIILEAKLYKNNYFVTLTYNDENLPANKQLQKEEIPKFNKKLKTYLNRRKIKSDFRFYACGEYGETNGRPHYHIIYFNLNLPDLKVFKMCNGYYIYTSKFLEETWNKGQILIEDFNEATAAYVAGYVNKKITATKPKIPNFQDTFTLSSRRPGIGYQYLKENKEKLLKTTKIQLKNGKKATIPRYFMLKLKEENKQEKEENRLHEILEINRFYKKYKTKENAKNDEKEKIKRSKQK